MSRYEKLFGDLKYTVLIIGLAMAIVGVAMFDQSMSERKLPGYLFALGIGVLLGIPPGNANFNLRRRRSSEIIWTILDLGVRLALIVAIELVLRQLDVRHAFKARLATIALLSTYTIHPRLFHPSDQVLHEKFVQHYQIFYGGLGLLLVATAFSLRDSLIVPLPELIGACGLALAALGASCWLGDLTNSDWVTITLLVVGLVATGVITGLVAGWWCILCLIVHIAVCTAFLASGSPPNPDD